jgi:periplasmic protein TonB
MKRLIVAAFLAAGLHGAAFYIGGGWTRPVLPLARSQSVTINLVSVHAPAAAAPAPALKQIHPAPKSKPKPNFRPKPIRREKPKPKPAARPRPESPPPLPQPVPASPKVVEAPPAGPSAEPPLPATETAAPAVSGPISHQEHAAIRESVPLYDRNPPPVYPRVARRRNYQGTVLLDVRVSADGTVAEAKVAKSSGYSVLDRSALKSVRHWLFEPARRGNRPIETWVQVPVRFELD